MGIQNVAARKLAVPDLTHPRADPDHHRHRRRQHPVGRHRVQSGRRLIAVAMLAGALAGAALVIHARTFYPLLIAAIVTGMVAAAAAVLGRPEPAWVHPGG